jgi:hypothetical protein
LEGGSKEEGEEYEARRERTASRADKGSAVKETGVADICATREVANSF